ncbi:MAG: rod shape-determining protein MreC [Spirochaetia bacterium]|jgi:rod shape-determining protein MreC|nr:rod shape-determining protein MreC [Spirochaetia bacterium]
MKNNRGKSRIKKETLLFILLLLINSILMISDRRGKETPRLSEIGFSLISVFQQGFSYISDFINETGNSINELKKIKTEYRALLKKVSEYESLEKDYLDLKRENAEMRRQLSLSSTTRMEKIPAQVTGSDPGIFYNTIIIDKGSKHGIKKDMAVVAFYEGFQGLVGRVFETGAYSSKVIPLYDKKFSAAARLQNLRYEGIISGNGDSKSLCLMNYVNKNARDKIVYGDLIITSGMSSIYPSGIYIGKVRSVVAKEYESSLELEIEPVVDFSRLEYVFVLSKEMEKE